MHNIYIYYFNNIYIIITLTCFDVADLGTVIKKRISCQIEQHFSVVHTVT